MATELDLAAILCTLLLRGETEVRHDYTAVDGAHYIRVDCETSSHVVEVGFDGKRSSYDSVHQVIFASELSGKLPMVVIIDTNGLEESVQYQVETVARSLNISYLTVTKDFLLRWQMTAPFRDRGLVQLFNN